MFIHSDWLLVLDFDQHRRNVSKGEEMTMASDQRSGDLHHWISRWRKRPILHYRRVAWGKQELFVRPGRGRERGVTVLTVIDLRALCSRPSGFSISLVSSSVSYGRFSCLPRLDQTSLLACHRPLHLLLRSPRSLVHWSFNTLTDLLSISAHSIIVAPGLGSSCLSRGSSRHPTGRVREGSTSINRSTNFGAMRRSDSRSGSKKDIHRLKCPARPRGIRTVRSPFFSFTLVTCSTNTTDVEVHRIRQIIINHIINHREIENASCDGRDHENGTYPSRCTYRKILGQV